MNNGRRAIFLTLGASAASCWFKSRVLAADDPYAERRAHMVAEIDAMARATAPDTGRAQFSAAVMEAMRKVPRHRFVRPDEIEAAYRNRPLPIGSGQTISQPYIVALSTDLIEPKKHHRVLEIGTGSGYQAAILAELVHRVYTIEIVETLARAAAQRLRDLGYANIEVRHGDGFTGWPDSAPFDGIVVTAAAREVPAALLAQLRPGGCMVIPIGWQGRLQQLTLVQKQADGSASRRVVLPVMFVPMTGGGS